MSKIYPTGKFKKHLKKVRKNPRWNDIFKGSLPFDKNERSPWKFIMDCFLNDEKIPDYFYEHPLVLTKKQKQSIKNRLGHSSTVKIMGLDLHFDGHNGDHLLIYIRTNQQAIYLVDIGSHSDLF